MLFSLARPSFYTTGEAGKNTWRSQFEISNYLSSTKRGSEIFQIDGETWLATNSIVHQLNDDTSLQLSIPWLKHGKGKIDRFLFHFHDIFQLPQNGRQDDRHNEMYWEVQHGNDRPVFLKGSVSGFGDIVLRASQLISGNIDQQWHVQIKLPTGEFDDQTGSEKTDMGLAFSFRNPQWLKDRKWLVTTPLSFWYGLGVNYIGHVSQLEAFNQNAWITTARTGLAWQFATDWQFKGQLDSHNSLFDSSARELGWVPLQATLAVDAKLTDNSFFSAAIIEDLRPRVTPDVIFSFELKHTF